MNKKTNLIISNGCVICPRCDGNGFLYRTTLEPINKIIILCDECEAMWLWPIDAHAINSTNFQDFTTYLEHLGYTYDAITLTDINYDWFIKQ